MGGTTKLGNSSYMSLHVSGEPTRNLIFRKVFYVVKSWLHIESFFSFIDYDGFLKLHHYYKTNSQVTAIYHERYTAGP